jgi:hypothetical protein
MSISAVKKAAAISPGFRKDSMVIGETKIKNAGSP